MELLAQGPDPRQRWRIRLQTGRTYVLGRNVESDLPVPWDPHVSGRHAHLTATADAVEVTRLPSSSNPLCYAARRVETCRVGSGEHFVIGSTRFHVAAVDVEAGWPDNRPVEEMTFGRRELDKIRYRDAEKRIDVLTRLPQVIEGARSEMELYHHLEHLILAGVVHADAVATVALDGEGSVRVLHWDRRRAAAGDFRPSGRLVSEALGKRGHTVLHVWEAHQQAQEDYTAMAEFDWAYCTPVREPSGDAWGLYVAGTLDRRPMDPSSPDPQAVQLQADVKFTDLVAEIISSVQRSNKLERQRAGYRQFFAPPILAALGDDLDTDKLEPRECDVTVLFCDLRGFSQKAEEAADDLLGLLDRVSRALEVMTEQILRHGGVPGDFQGDATLGFWGWPLASDESPLNACRAALGIRTAFVEIQRQKDHPLADFRMGIGISHGRAVAGKIGTREQVKMTVFGPVVNLASRLESMTKPLRVPILLDEATAEIVRRRLACSEGRTRKLAKILPYGMETPLFVSELLPPQAERPELTDRHVEQYELGVEHFVEGRWEEAYGCLHGMPASDRAQDFLELQIVRHNRVAPPTWDGVVRLSDK